MEAAAQETKEKITEELKDFRETVWSMESDIKTSLEDIGISASNAEGKATMPLRRLGSYPTSVENGVDARLKEKSGQPRTGQLKRLNRHPSA